MKWRKFFIVAAAVLALFCSFKLGALTNEGIVAVKDGGLVMKNLDIPEGAIGSDQTINAKMAGAIAEGIIRANAGWLAVFNKPFYVSYDEENSVWIVRSSSDIVGSLLGGWSETTFIIGKSGEIIAIYGPPF